MKKPLIALIIVGIVVLAGIMYWISGNAPVNPHDKSQKIFVINRGEAIREVGNNLKKDGLIKDAVAFFIYVKLNDQDKQIQAGDYRLSPSMSLAAIIETLNHGTLDRWVTIPEGLRAEEIADVFKKNLPSYDDSWRPKLDAQEGYLFPDTYLIPRDASVDQVIVMMKNNFDKRMQESGISESNTGFMNAVIIASIIQKEAKFAADFPIVSSVIHNRLDDGMALQVDPSVAYALGYQSDTGKWWKQELTFDDLKVNSLYNTYQHVGLPPGPIDNPGVQAIQAALNPATTDYMYYISDKEGHIHPAKTSEGHAANIQKYL
ncbi:MAG TPA: endolytic transglycosylase MltG [Patescibacteria group bacterium]|nr:endolytic transglycosylase MltG [Patescibacteria group bacterium]